MKHLRYLFRDPFFYLLLLLNIFFIYEYSGAPRQYNTIVWIFWCQSVIIGLFNFLELLTTRNVRPGSFKMNDQPVDPEKGRGCYAGFFLLHYQGFHVAYFVFLCVLIGLRNIDGELFRISLLALIVSQAGVFIRHKREYKLHPPDLSTIFFLPYLRIVPMHLMILLPAVLHWKPAPVFLILKTIFDLLGYAISTAAARRSPGSEAIPA